MEGVEQDEGSRFQTRPICSLNLFLVCHILGAVSVAIRFESRLNSSTAYASNSVHLPQCLARPRSPIFAVGFCSLRSSALFSALISSLKLLRNVDDRFTRVLG